MNRIPTLELRRKTAHIILVLLYALALWLGAGWEGTLVLLALAIIVAVAYALTAKRKRPFFAFLLDLVEREEHHALIPAKNALSLLTAGLVASLLLPKTAVVAGFLVLAIGDPLAYLVGTWSGKFPVPWNKRKHLEGRLAAILVCTPVLMIFYPWPMALLAAAMGMLFESVHYPHDSMVDDNLLVPLAVAAFLTLI